MESPVEEDSTDIVGTILPEGPGTGREPDTMGLIYERITHLIEPQASPIEPVSRRSST